MRIFNITHHRFICRLLLILIKQKDISIEIIIPTTLIITNTLGYYQFTCSGSPQGRSFFKLSFEHVHNTN